MEFIAVRSVRPAPPPGPVAERGAAVSSRAILAPVKDDDTARLRPATPADGAAYIQLVRGLADFEELAPPDDAAAARLLEHAFGPRPRYELLVVELRGELVAYAAFFETYSTFRALPSLYLEDVFVREDARRRGIGGQILRHLAGLALERGCGRFEWSVLDWNERAQSFYRSLGARIMTDWQLCRVDGEALGALARRAGA
jgi:GNAT superfamily N-acetyltransferase